MWRRYAQAAIDCAATTLVDAKRGQTTHILGGGVSDHDTAALQL
ncbi:hypothetical protein [Mycobacterium sp. SM1]|nr:hypothetical protein [Mycobacterium sp. SM1]